METVNVSFRYAEQDYVRTLRAHYAGRLRLPLDIAVIVGVAIIGVYQWRSGSHGWGIISLCLSGVLALMLVAAFAFIPRIAFRRQPKFRDEYSLNFSPEGIHFRTTHIDSDLKWGMYTWALVDAYSFILYYGPQQFTVIPKRVFESLSQRQAFEQLLRQNVSRVMDKTK
ncbi:MAG TPA: YcxB family protein [Candidatus Dormibacteraeota bacterium]|nr:YcxB family protein [Candidatus Dormibacteraeota bacterium]